MGKLKHIILREYTTRIRKKSFIVMTFLGPLLFAAVMIVPIWIATLEDQEERTIAVIEFDEFGNSVPDSIMFLKNIIKNKDLMKFDYTSGLTISQAEALVQEGAYFGVLIARHKVLLSGDNVSVEFLVAKQPSFGMEVHITNSIENFLHDLKLVKYNVPPRIIRSLKTKVNLVTKRADKDGFTDQGDPLLKRGVGYAGAFLIYMFIFMFGAQVMRGVVEEKTSRIIEVVITSVKPFQLMMGKTIGIGMVGLTQFFAWIILTFFIVTGAESYFLNKNLQAQVKQPSTELFQAGPSQTASIDNNLEEVNMSELFQVLSQINFKVVIGLFLFYFIGGYLLYSSMFAAVGAAVDSETDTQQFMLPVTIPLFISIVVMMNAISNPEGQVAYWFSIIPFTSPVVMMARAGFDIPISDFIVSATLLIVTYLGMTWISAKIYRTGILMYGKKVTLKEMFKWLRYK